MEKYDARVYVGELEDRIDRMLKKWKKFTRIEAKGLIQLEWQFDMARIIIDVFWGKHDRIKLECHCMTTDLKHEYEDLTADTAQKVMDRVGYFAQIVSSKRG